MRMETAKRAKHVKPSKLLDVTLIYTGDIRNTVYAVVRSCSQSDSFTVSRLVYLFIYFFSSSSSTWYMNAMFAGAIYSPFRRVLIHCLAMFSRHFGKVCFCKINERTMDDRLVWMAFQGIVILRSKPFSFQRKELKSFVPNTLKNWTQSIELFWLWRLRRNEGIDCVFVLRTASRQQTQVGRAVKYDTHIHVKTKLGIHVLIYVVHSCLYLFHVGFITLTNQITYLHN